MDVKPKILVLDNYDSFTYNLVHQLRLLGFEDNTDVLRNDEMTLNQVASYDNILLSPGPGLPHESGIMPDLIKTYSKTKSILGICLGHQAIAEAFGGNIYNLDTVFHGVTHKIKTIENSIIFEGLDNTFDVCRYHSWSVDHDAFPQDLIITALDQEDRIMALEHKNLPIYGLQFHPEAYTTKVGLKILENWIKIKI